MSIIYYKDSDFFKFALDTESVAEKKLLKLNVKESNTLDKGYIGDLRCCESGLFFVRCCDERN